MEYVKLNDVCDFINGDRGKNYPKSSEYVENGVPFINAGHIDKLKVNFSKMNYISEEVYEKLGSGKVQNRDILFCLRGSLGKSALVNFDKGAIASSLVILRNKNIMRLNTSYLMYVLNSNQITTQIRKTNTGSSQPNLSANSVKNYIIPLPDLEEQDYIVKILDNVRSLIDKRKLQITALSEFTQSVFFEMFGDVTQNNKNLKTAYLEDLCDHIIDCPHSTPKYEEQKTEFACIRTTEISNGYIDWSKMKYVNAEEYQKRIKRLEPQKGDIVYGREGSFGDAVILSDECNICLGQRVVLFRPNYDICNSSFLWAMLRSKGVYIQALRNNSGSTVGHVNVKDIKKFKCFLPNIEDQRRFDKILKKINEQKSYFEKSLITLQMYFNSLLQQAYKGALSDGVASK